MEADNVKPPKDAGDVKLAGGELVAEGEPIHAPAIERARVVLERVVGEALAAATFDHGADFRPGVALEEFVKRAPERMRDAGLVEQEPTRDPFADRATPALVEWFDKPPPTRQWLLTRDGHGSDAGKKGVGFLPLGKVGMLAAAGGVGKTMALVQLALSVATGREWLGDFTVPEASRGHVLLALGEEDAGEVHRRLYNAFRAMWPSEEGRHSDEQRRAMALAQERITVVPLSGVPCSLVTTNPTTRTTEESTALAGLRDLLEHADHEWSLVVLDPLSRFAGVETETDNAAATRFVQAVETLVTVPGNPTVLLAHHTTKGSRGEEGENASDTTDARGASAITDGVRWVARLSPVKSTENDPGPKRATLTLTKSNYGPLDKKRTVKRADGGALVPLEAADLAALKEADAEKVGKRDTSKGKKLGEGLM